MHGAAGAHVGRVHTPDGSTAQARCPILVGIDGIPWRESAGWLSCSSMKRLTWENASALPSLGLCAGLGAPSTTESRRFLSKRCGPAARLASAKKL